jgi:hypothetical protein
MFVIKGIAFRFNSAPGFRVRRRVRACTHHLSGLIGGRCVQARALVSLNSAIV